MNSTGNSSCLKRGAVCALVLFWGVCILLLKPVPIEAESPATASGKPLTIVIDPGHGGRDVGARGPTGLNEKTVTLDLARQLVLKLEPDFRVFLTRSDDYAVDLLQRAATANQSKADLMISIHTGSGFLHRTDGIGVYYYAPAKKNGVSQVTVGEPAQTQQWRGAHLRHRSASIALAKNLKTYLAQVVSTDALTIQGAPLKMLEGVNLPAVLVEIGHITHPATEMKLSAPEDIERLGHALSEGIRHHLRSVSSAAQSTPSPEPGP